MEYSLHQIEALVDAAYRKTRIHERGKIRQLSYEVQEERTTRSIAQRLRERTWRPKPLYWFVYPGPPVREVFTSPFEDAVVNMVLFMLLSPIVERRFIFDTYSCRMGKGTLFGVERFEHHLRSVTESWSKSAYVLSFDISGFFMSIIREKLFGMIISMLEDFKTRFLEYIDYDLATWLLETTLLRDPLDGCRYFGDPALIALVPPEKSIRYQRPGVGLTIGAVDHQLDSTIYLTPMDNLIKRNLNIRYYGRYVDDGRCAHRSYAHLEMVRREVSDFVKDYGLTIHPHKTSITDAYDGNTFLGASIRPFRSHARTPVMTRFRNALDDLDTRLATDACIDPKVELGPLNSRLGHMALYDDRAAVARILRMCPYVRDTYRFSENLSQARMKAPSDIETEYCIR